MKLRNIITIIVALCTAISIFVQMSSTGLAFAGGTGGP